MVTAGAVEDCVADGVAVLLCDGDWLSLGSPVAVVEGLAVGQSSGYVGVQVGVGVGVMVAVGVPVGNAVAVGQPIPDSDGAGSVALWEFSFGLGTAEDVGEVGWFGFGLGFAEETGRVDG